MGSIFDDLSAGLFSPLANIAGLGAASSWQRENNLERNGAQQNLDRFRQAAQQQAGLQEQIGAQRMATTRVGSYRSRVNSYDPSDPWYQRLKELELNHRGRVRLSALVIRFFLAGFGGSIHLTRSAYSPRS